MSEDYTDNVEGADGAPADGAPAPEPGQEAGAPEAGGYDPGVFDTGQDAASPEAFAAPGEGAPAADDVPPPAIEAPPVDAPAVDMGGAADPGEPVMGGLDDAAAAIAASQAPQPLAEPEPTPQAEVQVDAPEPEPKKKKRKKRKIDLKSRLSSVRATGSMVSSGSAAERKSDPLSFPPPPVSGGVPAPKIAGVSAPLVSSPFAPPEPEKKVSAQAQTIKVEVGEEIHQERAKARKKTAIYVALAAVVMGIMGFFLGVAREKGVKGNKAVEGAKALAEDVKTANTTMSDMSDALRNASEQLGQDEFPSALVETLKATNVNFSAEQFSGRSVGGLPPETFNGLLSYTNGVEKLNKQKDTLRNLLTQAKPLVEKYIKEKDKPTVGMAITFTKVEKNNAVQLLNIDKPFEAGEPWPEKFTVVSGSGKKKEEIEVKLWDGKGKVTAPKVAIPVSPKSAKRFTDLTLLFKLRKAMNDTRGLVDGVESPNPSLQSDGLLKEGKNLVEGLTKISRAGG